jgi:D-cysteine desulfhydrase
MTAARPAGLLAAPRVRLAALPTPVVPAPRLSDRLGVEVWVKRDDLTGVGLGGNKARKLEFLLGDPQAKGADALITGGGPGSNHIQITAAATAGLGIDCHLVLYGKAPDDEPINLAVARRLGAQVVFTDDPDRSSVDAGIEATAAELRSKGRRPYLVGRGGATPVGCLGYVEAAFELDAQLEDLGLQPSHLFLATGSCGTHAGLVLGQALTNAPWQLVGATVSRSVTECVERIGGLARQAANSVGAELNEPTIDVRDAIGPGYGKASREGREAAKIAASTEGLLLDPVFTAKAMWVLVTEARAGLLPGPVVFLHTGGTGGLMGGDP